MSNTIVTKFGGSSLSNAEQFKKVKEIIQADENRRYVIVSAPGKSEEEKHKVTDLLLMCYQLASHKLNFEEIFNIVRSRYLSIRDDLGLDIEIEKDLDKVYEEIAANPDSEYAASRGEYLNAKLMANYLGFEFIDAAELIRIEGKSAKGKTCKDFLKKSLDPEKCYVIPGFYGMDPNGKIRTFSRGGSDITGAIIACGVGAKLYENWTDVSGFLIADPSIVDEPKPIEIITYGELRELSYMGASVLHEEAVFPVREKKIPIRILNTNSPEDPGTLILADELAENNPKIVTGISGKKDYTIIRVEKTHMSEDLSFYRKLISVFETNDIRIEHMPTSIDTVSIVVQSNQIDGKEKKIREEISIYCNPEKIVFSRGLSIIAVVGRGMVSAKGTSARIFTALAKDDINIRMISQSSGELNIILGVENEDFENAIRAIYNEFWG